jgi:hypothetical protein
VRLEGFGKLMKIINLIWSRTRNHPATTLRRNTMSESFLRIVRPLLITANVPSSPILVTLIMEAIRSSEASVLTRARLRHIPEDGILHYIGRL